MSRMACLHPRIHAQELLYFFTKYSTYQYICYHIIPAEYLHVCKKTDPDPESCFTNSIQDLQTVFKTGDAKYDIPSLEPLELGDLLVSQNTANQGVKVSAKDIKSYGSSNYKISNMKVDFANNIYHFEVFLPRMRIDGRYVVDGRILLLPIHGSGRVQGNVTDCRGDTTMYGEKFMKDGIQFMRFNKMELKIKVGNGQFHLSNLFGGDKLLGDVINQAINQNFDLFVKDLIPLLEDALGKKFLSIGNSFMSRFTYDQLFPEK